MKTPKEASPPSVLEGDKQGGEVYGRWPWVEPEVWTERMLGALEKGVKGNQWFSLIDKVSQENTLVLAWEKVQSNAGSSGVDGMTIGCFAKDCARRLLVLKEQLRLGTYQPSPVKRSWIDKLGTNEKRPLGIPTVVDRIVQTALRMVIEPIFEHRFAEHSYGFRPGRGCKDALRRVQHLLDLEHTWVVDADLKSYFDTIPHERLMEQVNERIADGAVLRLIQSYLKQGVMEGLTVHQAGEYGTPQGAVVSPLLANLYLNPLDHQMAAVGVEMVRYADDFVILCKSEEEAKAALCQVKTWVEANGLTLHPQKTRLIDASQKGGFDFLGYHFERGRRWPRKKSMEKLKENIRQLTPRTSGIEITQSIEKLNTMLRGWFEYFKHSHRTTFPTVDGYVRGRLRSILRKRLGKQGRAQGSDHQLWPILYFHELGLFSLTKAHASLSKSLK